MREGLKEELLAGLDQIALCQEQLNKTISLSSAEYLRLPGLVGTVLGGRYRRLMQAYDAFNEKLIAEVSLAERMTIK